MGYFFSDFTKTLEIKMNMAICIKCKRRKAIRIHPEYDEQLLCCTCSELYIQEAKAMFKSNPVVDGMTPPPTELNNIARQKDKHFSQRLDEAMDYVEKLRGKRV